MAIVAHHITVSKVGNTFIFKAENGMGYHFLSEELRGMFDGTAGGNVDFILRSMMLGLAKAGINPITNPAQAKTWIEARTWEAFEI